MFIGNMVTEAIPSRVYALYSIVANRKEIGKNELQNLMEPEGLVAGKSSYFGSVLKAAIELQLVDNQDGVIVPIPDKDDIKSMNDFRTHAISKLGLFESEQFYKCTNIIVNMNEKIYKHHSIADGPMVEYLSANSGMQITAPMARGWRFWAQFLGFGYMNDFAFLPNAYVFSKSVITLMNLEKKKEYDIDDFMIRFNQYGGIIANNMKPERNMNIALSSALRELHDNGEIELKYRSDAKSRWILYPSNDSFNEQVASVVYKGVKK